MLNWIAWNRTDYFYKMDLALNKVDMPKTQPTNQIIVFNFHVLMELKFLSNFDILP